MQRATLPRPIARPLAALEHTGRVLLVARTRRRALAAFGAATVGYLLAFLYALRDLSLGAAGTGVIVVDDPLSRMVEPGPGAFTYEPVAFVEFGVGALLFSPINTFLGLGLAVLVGANLALSYLAIAQPASCGVGASTGVLAAVPALLGGSACCAPVVLIVLGIQAGALTASLFGWLLPLGTALLVVTLVYVAGKVDPASLRA